MFIDESTSMCFSFANMRLSECQHSLLFELKLVGCVIAPAWALHPGSSSSPGSSSAALLCVSRPAEKADCKAETEVNEVVPQ